MFDHPRSDWLPKGERFIGHRFQPERIERIVIHYIGTARAPRNSATWMLNEHRRTMALPSPYGYMYNSHVALDGKTWEGRGIDYRNAANTTTNPTTWSIVFGVDGQNPASPEQIAGARKLVQGIRSYLGRDIPLIPHRDLKATRCPGDGITAQIANGTFERNPNVTRLAGQNRYETATLVSKQLYPAGAKVVYIASGRDFADAISASMFKDGPLLLTDPKALPKVTRDEIVRLKVQKIVIIGGTSAVTSQVEAELGTLTV